ncbi:twin-arginine translocation signal domain-containing protein [Nonomuraea sp. NPDC001699]
MTAADPPDVPRALSRRAVLAGAGLGAAAAVLGLPGPADAAVTPVPLGALLGTNHAGTAGPGIGALAGMSWDRADVLWAAVEPTQGTYDDSAVHAFGARFAAAAANGVTLLPVLAYSAPWAARTTAYGWTHWDVRYEVGAAQAAVGSGWQRRVTRTRISTGEVLQDEVVVLPKDRTPPADPARWSAFVDHVVGILRGTYGVEYFQVWNEAYWSAGFWYGSPYEYVDQIHKPASTMIRGHGGKVVYGGWPSVAAIARFTALLTETGAWSSIDVLDVHYYKPSDLESLRVACVAALGTSLPIWQTEIGYSTSPAAAALVYPGLLHWAITRGLAQRPDGFKLLWYAWQAPASASAADAGRYLRKADGTPTSHGVCLGTVADLFDGVVPETYDTHTNDAGLTTARDWASGSVEGFLVGGSKIVIAVHTPAGWAGTHVTFTLASPPPTAVAARVDLTGQRTPLALTGGTVTVPLADAPGSAAASHNAASSIRTCYLEVSS